MGPQYRPLPLKNLFLSDELEKCPGMRPLISRLKAKGQKCGFEIVERNKDAGLFHLPNAIFFIETNIPPTDPYLGFVACRHGKQNCPCSRKWPKAAVIEWGWVMR